ncbi:hypothetical protein C8R45DRAFT_1109652 [Mycena sanguinolenta]|nr:hypothetical protein C8R45DRAFT_1109652 [Mycena sanguinolenta]
MNPSASRSLRPSYIISLTFFVDMEGLAVDPSARVLSSITHTPIPGLWAAVEVIGGAHGDGHGRNRLAGSSCRRCLRRGVRAGGGGGAA